MSTRLQPREPTVVNNGGLGDLALVTLGGQRICLLLCGTRLGSAVVHSGGKGLAFQSSCVANSCWPELDKKVEAGL